VTQDEGLPPAFQHQPYSNATSELIDAEVRAIIDGCQRDALRRLAANREALDRLANALLERESLDLAEVRAATGLLAA
jgi:cell division protease FtsH